MQFPIPGYFYFFTDQPRNPWQMLAEPLGSAETRLKITALWTQNYRTWNKEFVVAAVSDLPQTRTRWSEYNLPDDIWKNVKWKTQ